MALEFSNIPDRTGPAVYIFGDGTTHTEMRLKQFGEDVDKITPDSTQTIYLDPKHGDGLKVKEFYGLLNFPCVCIVMDDDTLHQCWFGHIPRADEVAHYLNSINGTITQ